MGAAMATDRAFDGRDLAPVLFGKADAQSPHDCVYHWKVLGCVRVCVPCRVLGWSRVNVVICTLNRERRLLLVCTRARLA
jgi:hypothetical protein